MSCTSRTGQLSTAAGIAAAAGRARASSAVSIAPQKTIDSSHSTSTFTTGAASEISPNWTAVMGSAKTMDESVQQSAVSMARSSQRRGVLGRSQRCSRR